MCSYLNVHNDDYDSETHQLRNVCSALSELLSRLLSGTERWNPYYWVDAIFPSCAAVLGPGELSILGHVILGEIRHNQECIEPFLGQVRVGQGANDVLAYRLLRGDAHRGLGEVRYGTPRRAGQALPDEWRFVFETNAAILKTHRPFSMFP